jgi:hypothetical protein
MRAVILYPDERPKFHQEQRVLAFLSMVFENIENTVYLNLKTCLLYILKNWSKDLTVFLNRPSLNFNIAGRKDSRFS